MFYQEDADNEVEIDGVQAGRNRSALSEIENLKN
jgi:hypothetical protein